MEVSALCVRLFMTVLLLLVAQVDSSYSQTADEAFPQVVPNRQQHFEYESVDVSCEGLDGLTGWRVMKKIGGVVKTCAPSWSTSTGPCQIKHAIPEVDSGEYWCELGGGRKTNSVNITATGVSVILDSPVLPVMEGNAVTLRCRQKQTSSSNLTAEFFKDGHFMKSSSAAEMTIHSVSTSNEGLYKCSISGAEGSPESWLLVRAREDDEPRPSPQPSSHHTPQLSLLLYIGLSVLALLLLVGLLRFRKHQSAIREGTTTSASSCQSSSSTQAVSGEAQFAVPVEVTYAMVTKPRKMKGTTTSASYCQSSSSTLTVAIYAARTVSNTDCKTFNQVTESREA